MVIMQGAIPNASQVPPRHPAKTEGPFGTAVKVTTVVPRGKEAVQEEGHEMPPWSLVTVPSPGPDVFTDNVTRSGTRSNCATIVWSLVRVTSQEPVPAHPLLQPMKVDPVAGVAVNVTKLLVGKDAPQVLPQLMPAW